MNNSDFAYILYQKDFSEKGNDQYFIYEDSAFSEITSSQIFGFEKYLVTHDYWLIAGSIFDAEGRLPEKVIDITMLSRILIGQKASDGEKQAWDISSTIKPLYHDGKDFDEYMAMYYRREPVRIDTYMQFAHKLAEYTEGAIRKATEIDEIDRFIDLELVVFNSLTAICCKGIPIDNNLLQQHKANIKLDYYREIKKFAEKHNVHYEIPNDGDIRDKLNDLGYDTGDYSTDYLLEFLPSIDDYSKDLIKVQKVNKSYRIFNSISVSTTKIKPIAETHSTSTSRIYFKNPTIQNLAKKYRDIFVPIEGSVFSYVDYDQFEVGIMAALSNDQKMKTIYEDSDAYIDLSNAVFKNELMRKHAKKLFLSYSYGMSLDNIKRSILELGGDAKEAHRYFSEFKIFENWKLTLYEKYKTDGRISTVCSNYLNRAGSGELSTKEQRSVVSHVVQGTGSYIFKKVILEVTKLPNLEILIPMHDAILIQHAHDFDPTPIIEILSGTMTDILKGKVTGKASFENFSITK